MRIRFNLGTGSRSSKKQPTEQGYYVSAVFAVFIQIAWLISLQEEFSELDFSSTQNTITAVLRILYTFIPSFIVIINLVKGIKLTRKRLNIKKNVAEQPDRESGYVYCPQCRFKLLEGIEVCPYCNEPIPRVEHMYEKEHRKSFEGADPEQKKKINPLMLVSVIILAAAIIMLIVYNVSNPYKDLESWEVYDKTEEIIANVTTENIGELGKLIVELESREYLDWEELKENYGYILKKLTEIEEYATYDNTANLRSTFAELINFDIKDADWNLEQLTDYYLEKYRTYVLFGKAWEANNVIFYWREENEEGYLRATLPNDKKYGITYYFNHRVDKESSFIIFYYETEDGDTFDAYQVRDVFYDENMGWTAQIYAISTGEVYIMH